MRKRFLKGRQHQIPPLGAAVALTVLVADIVFAYRGASAAGGVRAPHNFWDAFFPRTGSAAVRDHADEAEQRS